MVYGVVRYDGIPLESRDEEIERGSSGAEDLLLCDVSLAARQLLS